MLEAERQKLILKIVPESSIVGIPDLLQSRDRLPHRINKCSVFTGNRRVRGESYCGGVCTGSTPINNNLQPQTCKHLMQRLATASTLTARAPPERDKLPTGCPATSHSCSLDTPTAHV